MGALSPTHWLIVIGVLVVLFGAKRLPDAARGMGRSLRILRAETAGLHDDPQRPGELGKEGEVRRDNSGGPGA
ncbi:Sec-independent protein translocase subunit TatA [Pseudonocardia hispaniensis]|uniref:Sec-independent protein translocase protein TatA n=1 Tax=Pseudonocardia hispaniensis TaxID=904933 RepID=A0ABW1J8P8_9PSEU